MMKTLKEIWKNYASQYEELSSGIAPFYSDTSLLCALHLEIIEQLYTIAELAAAPQLERVPEQILGKEA